MHQDLVKRLRELHPEEFGDAWDFAFACQQTMHEAADAIEELSKPRWISVEERLPELCQNVLVSDGKWSGEGWLDRYDWHDPNREDVVYTSPKPMDFWCMPGCKVDEDHVTHWMPLPEPPKEVEK